LASAVTVWLHLRGARRRLHRGDPSPPHTVPVCGNLSCAASVLCAPSKMLSPQKPAVPAVQSPAARAPANQEMAALLSHGCCVLGCSGGRNRTNPIANQAPLHCFIQVSAVLSLPVPLSLTRGCLTHFALPPLQAPHCWIHWQRGHCKTSGPSPCTWTTSPRPSRAAVRPAR